MTTKILPSLFILILGFSVSIYAQQGQGRSQMGKGMGMENLTLTERVDYIVGRLNTELTLSDDQKTKISELYTAHFEAMDARRQSGTRATQQERDNYRTAIETSVKDVLTSEQKVQYDKVKDQLMPGPRTTNNNRSGNGRRN